MRRAMRRDAELLDGRSVIAAVVCVAPANEQPLVERVDLLGVHDRALSNQHRDGDPVKLHVFSNESARKRTLSR